MALWRPLRQKEQPQNEAREAEGPLSSPDLTDPTDQRLDHLASLIAQGLVIDGKIEGTGHVRIAGRFKGKVSIRGDLTIEQRAHISGEVKAENVVLKGKVEGNIHATSRVQLLETGVLIGDLKASSLTVATGSSMRGKVEFGSGEPAAETVQVRAGGGPVL